MEVRFWAATDEGKERGHNEDNFLVDRKLRLFVVCDGMGGHSAGEVASAVAVQTLQRTLRESAADLGLDASSGEAPSDDAVCEILERGIRRASDEIWQLAQRDESKKGMGTTCSAVMFVGDRGYVGHVGDSRIYRVRGGNVIRVTEDHSLRNEMVRQGKIGPDEPLDQENAVVRAVGVDEEIEVDTYTISPKSGDRFVLCSDGLTDYVDDDAVVADLVAEPDLEDAVRSCIEFANGSGGKDNVTVLVAEMAEGDGIFDARELRPDVRALRDVEAFQYLDPDELARVAEHTRVKSAEADSLLFGPGRPIDGLHLVLDGEVAIGESGGTAETVGPGDYFGMRALIGHEPMGFTAEASSESVRLLTLEREAFLEILGSDDHLAAKILWNCVEWLGERIGYLSVDQLREPEQLVDAAGATHNIDVSSVERPKSDAGLTPESDSDVSEKAPSVRRDSEESSRSRPAAAADRDSGVQSGDYSERNPLDSGVQSSPSVSEIAEEMVEEEEEDDGREQRETLRSGETTITGESSTAGDDEAEETEQEEREQSVKINIDDEDGL